MLHVANKLFWPHLSRTLTLSIFVHAQESVTKVLTVRAAWFLLNVKQIYWKLTKKKNKTRHGWCRYQPSRRMKVTVLNSRHVSLMFATSQSVRRFCLLFATSCFCNVKTEYQSILFLHTLPSVFADTMWIKTGWIESHQTLPLPLWINQFKDELIRSGVWKKQQRTTCVLSGTFE